MVYGYFLKYETDPIDEDSISAIARLRAAITDSVNSLVYFTAGTEHLLTPGFRFGTVIDDYERSLQEARPRYHYKNKDDPIIRKTFKNSFATKFRAATALIAQDFCKKSVG